MLLDKQAYFSDAQVITTGSDSGIASTNIIDFGAIRDIGVGENLFLVVQIDTTMADTGNNSTLEVRAQSDDADSFGSPTNTLLHTFAVNTAAGTKKVFRINPGVFNERYGRMFYTATNGALSAGAVSAFISHDVDLWTAYADGFQIS